MTFFVSSDPALLQLDRVHAFLSTKAYWCKGIPYETIVRAAANSLCFGAYSGDESVAERSSSQIVPGSEHKLSPASAFASESATASGSAFPPLQIGFARVVTDYATFAWICDVYVEDSARGHGVSKALIREILAHPELQGLRRICLGTHDAHELYEQFGFYVTKTPENWMEIKDDQIYLRGQST